jgi:hypothetical protein
MKGIIAILIFSLLFLSCASAGKQIDTSLLRDKIKLNESTKEDILTLFGEPLFKNVNQKDDTEMWHYASVKKNITATGILANRLGIGSEWRTNTQIIDFYFQKGIVINITDDNSDTTTFHLQ